MLDIRTVQSLEHPDLQPYLTLKRPEDHRRARIFVAEGEKVVRRLLASSFEVISFLLTPEWLEAFRLQLESRTPTATVFIAEKKQIEHLTGFKFFQGALAVAKVPAQAPLESILMTSPQPYLLLAVDGLANAENMGVLLRNCAAFGVHAFISGESSSSPFLRRAVRASMGAIFKLPVFESTNLAATLGELRRRGVRIIGAHPSSGGQTVAGTDFTGNCCIVLGSEGFGISSEILERCDECAAIPMERDVDSLNVSNASAVFLYEANRQRCRFGSV